MTSCWVLSDGKAGMENQCVGLAEALGLDPVVKRVRLRFPWKQLSPSILRWGNRYAAIGAPLAPPWPDLLIATGRHSVAPGLAVGQQSPATFRVQIQDPGIAPGRFDLVVVPRHDRLRGENVMVTSGALHKVTAAKLAEAAARFGPGLAALPSPRVAVLVGGDNGVYRLTEAAAADLAGRLAGLARDHGAGLMVTPSRRTGAANERLLRQALAGLPAVVWDGVGDNPYLGYLGLADLIVATGDSVSMVSEACSTGKPVYVYDLPGGSAKFARFHQGLRDDGLVRPFTGALDRWSYPPLDDTARVAAQIRRQLGWRG